MTAMIDCKRELLAFLKDWDVWADAVSAMGINSNGDGPIPVAGATSYYNRFGLCAALSLWAPRYDKYCAAQTALQSLLLSFDNPALPFGYGANYSSYGAGANCVTRRHWVKATIAKLQAELAPRVYARVTGFVDCFRPVGSYTVGKEYPVSGDDGRRFTITDDAGNEIPCWWVEGVDCEFERIIR